MTALRFFFSPASRYSYLALTQLPSIEEEYDVEFEWIPTVGGRIRALRNADPFDGPPLSGQYDWTYRRQDAEAWADYYGVPFIEPLSVEIDATSMGLAAIAAGELGSMRSYATALATEIFASGRWPIDTSLCIRLAEAVDLDTRTFERLLASPHTAERLESNCREAFEDGVFGNPTFFVGDRMFWGQDHLPLVRHALERTAR